MRTLSYRFSFMLLVIFAAASLFSCSSKTDEKNPYGLDIVNTEGLYKKEIAKDPDNLLVDLEKYIPKIALDIRYAKTDNFTLTKIYTAPKAFVRKPVAEALLEAENKLNNEGLGIKIFDAYRPYAATLYFYKVHPDTNFVAAPWKGSIHNRGCAVDLTLIDIVTGQELPMPTAFDEFTDKAAITYMDLEPNILANREKLISVMKSVGFDTYEFEWWHFNFKGREKYKIMDISFEDLEKFDFNSIK